jgi:glycosyltransferase involved in cell wall biosynthesis
MHPMRFTIVTPSFNQAAFLQRTIDSVVSQDWPAIEYFVIDGGSRDGSQQVIRDYAEKISYWVSEPDRGQADAINKGLRRATGDVVGWLNSDDLYLPGALRRVAEYFEKHPAVDCVYGDLRIISRDGAVLYDRRTIPYHFRTALFSECLVPQPAAFWRRSVMERIGLLDVSLTYQMDYEYFVRMGACGVRFGHIPDLLAAFRLHEASKTVSQYDNQFFAANREIKQRYTRLPIGGSYGNQYLKAMRLIYRARSYAVRVALRRSNLMPGRVAAARQSASHDSTA